MRMMSVVGAIGIAIVAVGASLSPVMAGACRDERADAATLVDRCLEVSPATHPPCNASNACALIISEISRGCAMLDGKDRPAYCAEYAR